MGDRLRRAGAAPQPRGGIETSVLRASQKRSRTSRFVASPISLKRNLPDQCRSVSFSSREWLIVPISFAKGSVLQPADSKGFGLALFVQAIDFDLYHPAPR
jgi:hypothetical protein